MCSVPETYAGGFQTGVCVGSGFTAPLMLGFKKPNKGHFLPPSPQQMHFIRPAILSLSHSRSPQFLCRVISWPFFPFLVPLVGALRGLRLTLFRSVSAQSLPDPSFLKCYSILQGL